MNKGISYFQMKKAFRDIDDPDINGNFMTVFPANHINRFIDYKSMISEEKSKYLFIIADNHSSDKNDKHWWSILDFEPKTDLIFFYTFGADGLKSFIKQDNKKVIEKYFLG